MDDKLKPCPFCGSQNVDAAGWMSEDTTGPACDDCGASSGLVSASASDNIAAWNTRPAERDALREALASELIHYLTSLGPSDRVKAADQLATRVITALDQDRARKGEG